ncbi:MAG TPA: tetratricopeptide repeat protein, partial [Aggregicoccus sp.]|nr:tetratricopeptide repeat protein [Aggregicoccus sp.]
ERRAEARLAQRNPGAAAASFFTAARLYADTLSDPARALAAADRALAAQPTHADALELRGRLCIEAQQFSEAAAMLGQRVQLGGEPTAIAALHLTLGGLYHDQLGDPGRAAAHLQTALTALPRSEEALERLAEIHAQGRSWTGAVDCLERLLALELSREARARHSVALARVQDEGLGDVHAAAALYRQALELTPNDSSLVDRLISLSERAGNLAELAELLQSQAQTTTDPRRALSLRLKVAELAAGALRQPERAVALYKQVLEASPAHVPARAALAELYLRDAAAAPLAVEEHRQLLRVEAGRVESLHALFRLWAAQQLQDKAFCAAAVLQFLRSANEAEQAFYTEGKARLPAEPQGRLGAPDVEAALLHPAARGAVLETLRAVGDQLSRLYPPQFEVLGVERKADRLKAEHPVARAVRAVAQVFGVEELEVYSARRGLMGLETTEPLCVWVGQDVVRKFNPREQKFLMGRAALGLLNRSAVLQKLSAGETAELLGSAVRIHVPDYSGLGRRNDELTKQLRKACSRKTLKALEAPAHALADAGALELQPVLDALTYSADRAGLLLCGDVSVALGMVLREDPNVSTVRLEGADPVRAAVRERADLGALLDFALSEDFFRLRQKLGLAL